MRLLLAALMLLTACAHVPAGDPTALVDVWRGEKRLLTYQAVEGAYEITGGLSGVLWYARSEVPLLASGLVVAGLEFTAARNADVIVVIPFALVGAAEDRLDRYRLDRLKLDPLVLRHGESAVLSHFPDGTKMPFTVEVRARQTRSRMSRIGLRSTG